MLLQEDILLRHYDRGSCKNKLGHSRASVIWHRVQVCVHWCALWARKEWHRQSFLGCIFAKFWSIFSFL